MIIGVHHVQITIPKGKEAEARDFYCGVMGVTEIAKPESLAGRGGFWFQAGSFVIHIGTENTVDRSATKAHVAYEVDNISAMKSILIKNGVQIIDSVPIPGFERFEFRDPFGNRVECIQDIR